MIRSDRPVALNCEESNGHLLAFSYHENTIYVNVYHGQMDGTGLYRLSKALIYYYCCRRYNKVFDVPDVALPDDRIEPEEYRDVYRDFLKVFLKVLKEKGISCQVDSFGRLTTPDMHL